MKKLLTIMLFFAGTITQAQTLSLNGTWHFKTDPSGTGEKQRWFDENINTAGWDSMPVPGNWDLFNDYSHYAGKAWYTRKFRISRTGEKLSRIVFEAVYHDSKVWLNGQLLGENNSGFLPFQFEISKLLHYDRENTITVCADNSFRRGAIWNWGGIRRPVNIETTDPTRIIRQHISTVVDLGNKTAKLNVELEIKNDRSASAAISGEVQIMNPEGFSRNLKFTADIAAGTSQLKKLETIIDGSDLHLWNCDDPFLYSSKAVIRSGEKLIDENTDRFGIRKIEADNKNFIFKLNGTPMRIMGFNLVPDDRTTGNTLPAWRFKEDIDLMKSTGANLARLTHLPLPKEMLDYLDEKGIMTFAEIPLWGFDQLVDKDNPKPKEWLKRLVETQFNHPAIIGWCVGNEIGHVPGSMQYVESAIKYVRTLDTTRLAVMVSHTADRAEDPIQYSDMGLINKYGANIGSLADKIHNLHPEKLLFYTEYGYGQIEENLNSDINAKAMLDSLRFKPYLMGGSLWTFNDYRSSYPGTKEGSENRAWGVVDVYRQKKKAWYSLKKEYAPVRSLRLEGLQPGAGSNAAIIIEPRKSLDLPAYPLHNYRLVWTISDSKGKIMNGGFVRLKNILPGDTDLKFPMKSSLPAEAAKIRVSLLAPSGYSVADTVIFFLKPSAPKIISALGTRTAMNDLGANSGNIRVVFEKNSDAVSYKVKYGKTGLDNETETTMNDYLIIPKLAFGDIYQVAVVAVNSAGESEPGQISRVTVGPDFAPPVITYTEPADNGVFIGYPSDAEDYLFRVKYTTKSGDYSNADSLQTANKGLMFVPGLKNGTTFYFKMAKRKPNNYVTGWTEEFAVTPDGGVLPLPPKLNGVIRQDNEAIVSFAPVKKSVSYIIQYKTVKSGQWTTQTLNAAQMEYVLIKGLNSKMEYEFRIASVSTNGESGYSDIFKK